MKWKFGSFSQGQLGIIRLLLIGMGMACARNAPRYEPKSLDCQYYIENSIVNRSTIEEPSTHIANTCEGYPQFSNTFYTYYKHSYKQDVAKLLKDIDYKEHKEVLILSVVPLEDSNLKDFSSLIEKKLSTVTNGGQNQSSRPTSNRLPNRLCIFFERNREDGSWDERKPTTTITISPNPALPNLKKHCFSLIAFLIDIPTNTQRKDPVAFIKSDQNWFFYNNDNRKIALSTADAMYLASNRGTTFFYQKSDQM